MTANTRNPNGFGFVDIVGKGWEGHLNLFWKDQVLAMVPPPTATEIRATLKAYRLEQLEPASGNEADLRPTLAYGVRGNRYLVKTTRGEIHNPPYDDQQIIELVDRVAPVPANDCTVLVSLLSRLTNELKAINSLGEQYSEKVGELIREADATLEALSGAHRKG
ncbi:hypothetical protein PZT57_26920 [Pseudomonas aeruginosa]|uniref:hypothetical protein n=1 Tax=Pseudomonas aeruginosa TaxID=287 RepID=UPI002B26B02B|nr:hypothetical protein [Pseudomonas aeruginosa]MEA8592284.1 hypothetical protein [Pseudomonas aeruginosa]